MTLFLKTCVFACLTVALTLGLWACQTQGTLTSIISEQGESLTSWLTKPEGEGPFPAVVLIHGCGGLEKNTSHQTVWRGMGRHAAFLNNNGYVTLIVDSFSSRRITDGCQRPLSYYPLQIRDAQTAFDHLDSLPFVDSDRIGLVGLSLGGGTALRMAQSSHVDNISLKGKRTFSAFVAYYPWCEPRWGYLLDRPILIMTGAEDNWTPATRCIGLVDVANNTKNESIIELKVYPGAHHSFDLPMGGPYYVEGDSGRVHTVQGDDGAWRDSQERMLAFFTTYLGPGK